MSAEKRADGKLLRSTASSVTRVMKEKLAIATSMGDPQAKSSLKQVVRPNSFSKTMRSTGVALILAPEPITAVPGAVMLGVSLWSRRRETRQVWLPSSTRPASSSTLRCPTPGFCLIGAGERLIKNTLGVEASDSDGGQALARNHRQLQSDQRSDFR